MNTPGNPQMSWEEAVRWLLDHPDEKKRNLARACYFDGSPLEAAQRFADSPEFIAVEQLLPAPSGRLLDIGAGRGISSFAFARSGWRVSAIEPDVSDLVGRGAIGQIAAESGLSIDVRDASAEDLPFADGTFDVVYCRQALHHARDLDKMCSEAIRVLRKGGIFIATREHVLSHPSDLQGFLDRHPLNFLYGGECAYTLQRYRDAIVKAGPSSVEVFPPRSTIINLFPSSFEAERAAMGRVAGVKPEDIPDYIFKIRDQFDQTPGRLYSFRVTK